MLDQDSKDALDFYLSEEEFLFQEWKERVENLSGEDLERFREWESKF